MDDKQRILALHGEFARSYSAQTTYLVSSKLADTIVSVASNEGARTNIAGIASQMNDLIQEAIFLAVLDGALAERVRYERIVYEAAR